MAKTTKLNIIKPALGVTGLKDGDLIARLNAVHDGMVNNPAYATPPVDMAGFKAGIDAYTAAVAAALDGGKAALSNLDKRRADVIIMYRLLGHYVEVACKNDQSTFDSSGFVAAKRGQKTPPAPVAVPSITAIDQGANSGQLVVTVKAVAKARSYDLRYAAAPAAGGAVTWTTMALATVKPTITINGLTPGTTYSFQARAFGKLGFSDWSDSVNRMCI
jgi:hypothetical protein